MNSAAREDKRTRGKKSSKLARIIWKEQKTFENLVYIESQTIWWFFTASNTLKK